jgi:hypothetical protein
LNSNPQQSALRCPLRALSDILGHGNPRSSKLSIPTVPYLLSIFSAFLFYSLPARAQNTTNTDYFGKIQTPPTFQKNGKPNTPIPDPFLSPLLKDGRTNVPLTPEAVAAEKLRQAQQEASGQYGDDTPEQDRSVHLNVVSGSFVQVLITTDHAVQLSVLRNGEVVRPTNIILGSNEFVQYVYSADSSPYIYVSAKVALPGQTTDMFIETHEDGRVQTYVLKLICVEPSKVVYDVLLDLTNDNTPYMQGKAGSREAIEAEKEIQDRIAAMSASQGGAFSGLESPWSVNYGAPPKGGAPGSGFQTRKFSRDDIRKYFPRMVQMAKAYDDAKFIEANGGRQVYTDAQIRKGLVQDKKFIDPLTQDSWILRPWFFPQMDAIVIEAAQYNPNDRPSGWSYNLIKWRVGEDYQTYDTTAAFPEQPAALPRKINRVWLLLQGYNIGLDNRFTPLMPDRNHRLGR